MKNWKLIAGVLLLAAAGVTVFLFGGGGGNGGGPVETQTVRIRYGSEKKGLLHDEEFIRIMAERYGLVVDGVKMGSLEMSHGDLSGVDGLWPSSELAAMVFADRHPNKKHKKQIIFNTPIVFYSWPEVTEALVKAGVVERRASLYHLVDTREYLGMIVDGTTWRTLGLARQNGPVLLHSTDPTKSNSGFLISGLIAVTLEGGMVDAASVEEHLPVITDIYRRMGFLENSTGILFDKYIKQGQGAFPIIAAYESLIIEFYKAYPDYRDQIKNRVRVLVPEPTIWSEHPFIAFTEPAEKLLAALQDPDVQKLAWRGYGFRSGVMGIDNDPAILEEIGLPERIESVIRPPAPGAMDKILEALR